MTAYYFLPGTGIYGGIKVGFQLLATLRALGVRAVAVTPDGRAPDWFAASVPVLADDEAMGRVRRDDLVFFSLPHDYSRLAALPGRLVFHCQGTDPLIDPVLDDRRVTLLSCWPQATEYMRAHGRDDVSEIGIAIPDAFFYSGRPKYEGTIAHMPRRGRDIVTACRRRVPTGRFVAIDGLAERAVAARMQGAEIYLATSVGEWFGLPALEAMAAGCVVISVPVLGGVAYLRDGVNCRLASAAEVPEALAALVTPSSRGTRARLRAAARATAGAYREGAVARRVRAWLIDIAATERSGAANDALRSVP